MSTGKLKHRVGRLRVRLSGARPERRRRRPKAPLQPSDSPPPPICELQFPVSCSLSLFAFLLRVARCVCKSARLQMRRSTEWRTSE